MSGIKDVAVEAAYGNFTKHMVAHGAHEVAAALFNGQGFVMYPRGTREDPAPAQQHAVPEQKQEQKQDRGLSM